MSIFFYIFSHFVKTQRFLALVVLKIKVVDYPYREVRHPLSQEHRVLPECYMRSRTRLAETFPTTSQPPS